MKFPRIRRAEGVRALMFHGVCEVIPEYAYSPAGRSCMIESREFTTFLDWCLDRYDVIRLDDLERAVAGEWSGKPPVLLTFDDGLASVVDLAVPVLRRHGISAVMFVTTEWTNGGRTPDIFELERAVSGQLPLRLSINVEGDRFDASIRSHAEASRAFAQLWTFLLKIRFPPLKLRADQVRIDGASWDPLMGDPPDRHFWYPATWDELRACVSEGVLEIGSHMTSHEPLMWLPPDEQRRQLLESRDLLTEVFDQLVTTCSYPHGFVDDRTEAIASEIYRWSFNSRRGRINRHTRAAAAPRYYVPGEAPKLLMRELEFGRPARWLARLGL
jgi:peptidoglycan/xylan/chitin deacetylase (PgdA/CDA1 family)